MWDKKYYSIQILYLYFEYIKNGNAARQYFPIPYFSDSYVLLQGLIFKINTLAFMNKLKSSIIL